MRLKGFGAKETPDATIRIGLVLNEERDDAWSYLFLDAMQPGEDELEMAYATHGVAGSHVYMELKPEMTEATVLSALDWLEATVADVDGQRRRLDAATERARNTARIWFETNVGPPPLS